MINLSLILRTKIILQCHFLSMITDIHFYMILVPFAEGFGFYCLVAFYFYLKLIKLFVNIFTFNYVISIFKYILRCMFLFKIQYSYSICLALRFWVTLQK